MSLPDCLPDCDEQHAEGCPRDEAERRYWASYFGQDRGTPAERRATLERMRPVSMPREEGDEDVA